MDAAGKRRPIWITEFSYYGTDTYPSTPFFPDTSNWAEGRMLKDEKQCADYVIRFYTIMMSFGVDKIFIHAGSSGPVNTAQYECCLFDYGGVPKKVFAALAVFNQVMGTNPKFTESRQLGGTVCSFTFKTDNGPISVLWDAADDPKTAVPIPEGYACYDIMGRRIQAERVVPGSSAIYLVKR